MTLIVYAEPDGALREVDGAPGMNLMQLALDNGVSGILGDCGGCCSCATCHVYIDAAWCDRLPPPKADEMLTLECVQDRQPNSRLACQLRVDPALQGLRLQLPDRQI